MFLGDYIDRGPDSLGVLTLVKELDQAQPGQIIALRGNHEQWFLDWIDADDTDPTWLLADAGFTTTRSFLPPEVIGDLVAELTDAIGRGGIDAGLAGEVNAAVKKEVTSRHRDLIAWLRRRPLYYETDTHVCVHAGVDEEAGPHWKTMTPDEVFTDKYPPSLGAHTVGKTIVAGHVGVGPLHAAEGRMRCWDPFVDDGHIYLDGSVESTGQLNVMRHDGVAGTTDFI
ncbi:serine/threonine protein phosphatase [Gordonia neofelifaecis NRRL B-59395]|uniref:Serine/threonine protein phosphatase n=1 Tax=Gordonia neofelifaecis NRRL B-59395 TaxID=644548 RepID=F1YE50_9ACTN|nr:serine/threonine protein phosphatase [Gordonia neofelifaecis NRRL B-59395]